MLARLIGAALIAVSTLTVVQTVREIVLATRGDARYTEEYPRERTITFGGHTIVVTDDLPYRPPPPATGYDERAFDGLMRLSLDGRPLGEPSLARIRPGRGDLGRYHLWLSAWIFRERAGGPASLWVGRRLQPDPKATTRYEITTVTEDGTVDTRVLRSRQLSTDYRRYRAAQFLSDGGAPAFPFALGAGMGFFPILMLVYPVGSFALGVWLFRRRARPITRR